MMNLSHSTIKDKEVPRWQPLQRWRMPHMALSKLSPKKVVMLSLMFIAVLFYMTRSFINGDEIIDPKETDDEVLKGLRKELRSTLSAKVDRSKQKPTAFVVTAHTLYNASGITSLACKMAAEKKMNVVTIYAGMNSTETVPFFLRANGFGQTTCPMIWHDARHEYSTVYKQTTAMEDIIGDAISYMDPSVVVYVDDEEDWFMQSLERSVYWRRPAISLVQLKREALVNLHWIASLSPSALAAWNIPQIDIAITTSQSNTGTLYRLIESLLGAEYIQPSLPRLFITFNPGTASAQVLGLLRKWPADRLILRHQIAPLHTSFPGALQSWYPADDDNYVLALQDDVELSPWYMYWLHLSLMKYVYSDSVVDSSTSLLTGISLQSAPQPRNPSEDKKSLDIRRILLMAPMYAGWLSYATPYVWQQTLFHSTLFFPSQWREFHTYISLRESFGGGIPSITNEIKTFSSGDTMTLEIYWLELLLARGYAILYPNFDDAASFAVQHIESSTAEDEVETPLLQWGALFDQIGAGLPDWEDLPVLDFEKRVVGWDSLERTSRRYQSRLSTCKDFPEEGWEVRDLFCFPDDERHRSHIGNHEDVHNHDRDDLLVDNDEVI